MRHYTKEEARSLLPKVGDQRWEVPTIYCTDGFNKKKKPQRCIVIDVRPEHLWYTVQFENGTRESYKVPHPKLAGGDEDA